MLKKWFNNPSHISSILEHFMALLVLIGIIIATISLKDSFFEFWHHRMESHAFLEYIDAIFKIVIGIEFFKLLWKPQKETVVEVLMFVLARHMIIEHTTAIENLLIIVSICLLFVTDKYLLDAKHHLFEEEEASKKDTKDTSE